MLVLVGSLTFSLTRYSLSVHEYVTMYKSLHVGDSYNTDYKSVGIPILWVSLSYTLCIKLTRY